VRIFVTRRIPDAGLDLLKRTGTVEIGVEADEAIVSRERLLEGVSRAEVLVSLLTEPIDRKTLEAGKSLRGIANYAVGYNNVDVAAATELGIPVANTPGVLTDTTADLAWALLLSVARNVVPADRYMREGRYKIWGPSLFLGADVGPGGDGRRKVLGIVGFGRIGQAVFRRAIGFEMRVLAFDPPMRELIEKTEGVEYAEMDRIVEECDFLSIHTDLNPSTRHLISGPAFDRMKPTAILVNTARGPIVDEKALVEALREGKIAGAGLDVFEDEPAMAEGLAELPNVVVLPHIASATRDTRNRMAVICAENAAAHARRERAPNCVNPEVYQTDAYRRRSSS
jgi:lactate dehydrogenase-like 2-hydroxyacid dehydrogenase